MKKSDIPTPYILVGAYSNDFSEDCDFAIIEISTSFLQELENRFSVFNQQISSKFINVTFYDSPKGFFRNKHNCPEDLTASAILGSMDFCFIDITEQEIENLEIPESRYDEEMMVITDYKNFYYTATAKYTEATFRTNGIHIQDLKDALYSQQAT
ncbi:hypothetical protein SAMN05428988_3149 [Chitinophaga sp. YR573]|uniref:hypothetical protein n=1 Tax=Chitinophaga sp. YR573 TaxID=1881040 RepID=UPI0008AF26FA|nr:hypothetical protein [Chitinophaga sp. YR573]SEW20923.1 hypothetical protein SAMN05428988_3149 [Chitinophaga sp. YR573]